jgi:hypothetical protein
VADDLALVARATITTFAEDWGMASHGRRGHFLAGRELQKQEQPRRSNRIRNQPSRI